MPNYRAVRLDHFSKTSCDTFPNGYYFALFKDDEHLGNLFSATQGDVNALLATLSGVNPPPRPQNTSR